MPGKRCLAFLQRHHLLIDFDIPRHLGEKTEGERKRANSTQKAEKRGRDGGSRERQGEERDEECQRKQRARNSL